MHYYSKSVHRLFLYGKGTYNSYFPQGFTCVTVNRINVFNALTKNQQVHTKTNVVMADSEKSKKSESKSSVIEFVEGWDMIQTLGEGAFGE